MNALAQRIIFHQARDIGAREPHDRANFASEPPIANARVEAGALVKQRAGLLREIDDRGA